MVMVGLWIKVKSFAKKIKIKLQLVGTVRLLKLCMIISPYLIIIQILE